MSEKNTTKIYDRWGKLLFEAAVDKKEKAVLIALQQGEDLSLADLDGVDLYAMNLKGINLRCSRLVYSNLVLTELQDSILCGVNFGQSNLWGTGLSRANLMSADMVGVSMQYSRLGHANLEFADMRSANLSNAYLRCANLKNANLRGANLRYANLNGANLKGAELPAPAVLLMASWEMVSDELCRDLMTYNAACHPDPSKFDEWAKGGDCPYKGMKIQRAANFSDNRSLWDANAPLCRPYELMVRVMKEKCPDWTEQQRKAFEEKFAKNDGGKECR